MKKIFFERDISVAVEAVLKSIRKIKKDDGATVVTLSGDLGAGKTTLTRSIATELGVKASVISPTFIIMKKYVIRDTRYKTLIHIDAYRLDSYVELEKLGWNELLKNPDNLILIEWPEKVEEIVPEHAITVSLRHIDDEQREIIIG